VRELPTGTVTFLFTDIEGSTRLLHELGDAYADALAGHRRALREAFAAHDGLEVDTQGDAFFVAFARAGDALAAAREGQEALGDGPIRVRMGLHTGEPLVTEEGYVGLDVHRAARIAAVGHGGQVLVSQATRELVSVHLRELGKHRLKDFAEPVALFQLGEGSFPPLRTISNTNLPHPASSFVGREREIDELLDRLRNGVRLLTLTGPGGSGKTRLAIEAAEELVPEFKAGVFWVGLAPVRDPSLALDTIGQTLGAKNGLAEHVGERELLLLLDNFEQVIDVAPELASLVERCPNLRLLVTSRELLRVRGEIEYAVEPLAEREAVELFRARAVTAPDEAVDDLCRALDNLPLALELAAARTSVLSPRQILERVSERLDLLKGGRDADPRQLTLRATIDWSYELLSHDEQRLFARLAVFSRGCTLEAAEHVADADVDTLQGLVDKSLLRHTDERFWMLETIREAAAERLRDSDELAEIASRHARHYQAVAAQAEPGLQGPRQSEELTRLEADLDNLRRAIRWSLDTGDVDQALAIVVSLERFWSSQGRAGEAIALVEAALERGGDSIDPELRARALWVAGFHCHRRQETERAVRFYLEALPLLQSVGRDEETVQCLSELAVVRQKSGLETEATELAEQALAVARRLDDPRSLSAAWYCLAILADERGDYARAVAFHEKCAALRREIGDLGATASSVYNLGLAARALGEAERSERAFAEALDVASGAGHTVIHGASALNLGYMLLARGDLDRARSLLQQGLEAFRAVGDPTWTAEALNLAAAIGAASGDDQSAALLWGTVDALLESAGTSLDEIDAEARDNVEPGVRSRMGDDQFKAAVREGRRLPVEQALRLAMTTVGSGDTLPPAA
jgi:predicted ATPase